jgi:DNA-binding NarL/FixJ family response regulator
MTNPFKRKKKKQTKIETPQTNIETIQQPEPEPKPEPKPEPEKKKKITLTASQNEIFRLYTSGLKQKEIAKHLNLSVQYVSQTLILVRRKLRMIRIPQNFRGRW